MTDNRVMGSNIVLSLCYCHASVRRRIRYVFIINTIVSIAKNTFQKRFNWKSANWLSCMSKNTLV